MKILGTPGPSKVRIVFDTGDFIGRTLLVESEPIDGGILLYSDTINFWEGDKNHIDQETKLRIIKEIKNEFEKIPNCKSEIY